MAEWWVTHSGNDGNGGHSEPDALRTIKEGLNQWGVGDVIFIKADQMYVFDGSDQPAETLAAVTSHYNGRLIKGYSSTKWDEGVAVLDWESNTADGFALTAEIFLGNLEIRNCTGYGVKGDVWGEAYKVKTQNCGTAGLYRVAVRDCSDDGSGVGFQDVQAATYCRSRNATTIGIVAFAPGRPVAHCLVVSPGTVGISDLAAGRPIGIEHCTVYGIGAGVIGIRARGADTVKNCILANASSAGTGIDFALAAASQAGYNGFYNMATPMANGPIWDLGNDVTADPKFVNAGAANWAWADYVLESDSPCIGAGSEGQTMGAMHGEVPTGGATQLVHGALVS